MKKNSYAKPVMAIEVFSPHEFVAACTMPGNYRVYAPFLENGKAEGWQDYGMNDMDDWYQNNWYIYFDSYSIREVQGNDYSADHQGRYWEITLGSEGKLVYSHNGQTEFAPANPIAAGATVWKNLGNGVESGVVEPVSGGKNAS